MATAVVGHRTVAATSDRDRTARVWDLAKSKLVSVVAEGVVLVGEPATGPRVGTPETAAEDEDGPEEFLDAVTSVFLDGRASAGRGLRGARQDGPADVALGDRHSPGRTPWPLTTTTLDDRPVALIGGSDGTVRTWNPTTREQAGPDVVVGCLGQCRARGF
ncbi:hypothetical protein ACFUCQ_05340 [Streptomyces sp. NPDC057197]|uniref:hypothetical protein n=1 Tax=Streptomyces sp. NPDC057197 TaxID=3346045 RepID=UPI003634DFA4